MEKRFPLALVALCLLTLTAHADGLPSVFLARPTVELGAGVDRLTNQYQDWSHQYLDVVVPMKEQGLLFIEGLSADRYGTRDQAIDARYSVPFDRGTLSAEWGYSSPAHFLARNTYGVSWNGLLPQGYGYSVEVRDRRYSTSRADAYTLGIEKYIGAYRLAYAGTVSTINDQQSQWSNKVQLQWMGERSRWGFTVALGFEPEEIGVGTLSSVHTELYQVDGVYPLSPDISGVLALWHAKQGSHYEHNGGQIGIRLAF